MKRLIALYLSAIVAANLTVTAWGPEWSIVNAFLFIGLDLTARDGLHESWQGRGLWPRMGALIAAGSLLSWAVNADAGRIALASFVAFAAAATADTLVFQAMKGKPRFDRITGSNVVASAVDSVLFPLIAFGLPLMWTISFGQFAAKVGGGVVWAWILFRDKPKCQTCGSDRPHDVCVKIVDITA